MISIVTGTLNRKWLLPKLIENTVQSNELLELVLVDGGSTDGSIEMIKELNHPQVKLIEVGGRSSYPHFMNLGIRSAKHDFICQWNDDALLVNDWNDVINEINDSSIDAWLFTWQYVDLDNVKNESVLKNVTWNLGDEKLRNPSGEIVMNYGIYRKDLFKKFGMFDRNFMFYYADGELSHRFFELGAKFKACNSIKVASVNGVPKLMPHPPQQQWDYYSLCRENHLMKRFQSNLEML